MKKIYIIGTLLVITFGLIALRPEHSVAPQTAQPSATSEVRTSAALPLPAETHATAPVADAQPPVQTPNVTILIEGTLYPVYAAEGATVLDAMREATASSSFAFSGREHPGLGLFVESINGKKSAGGYYWFLYINGVSSDTGASQTMLHPGDVAEWRYKQSDY